MNIFLLNENYIFLNDINFSKEKIKKLDSSKTIIYSMNFKVHQHLESLSIKHEIGEDVLDENDLNLIFDKTVIDRILESIKPIEKTETTKEIVPGLITITGKHSQRINLFELISNLFSK